MDKRESFYYSYEAHSSASSVPINKEEYLWRCEFVTFHTVRRKDLIYKNVPSLPVLKWDSP